METINSDHFGIGMNSNMRIDMAQNPRPRQTAICLVFSKIHDPLNISYLYMMLTSSEKRLRDNVER